LELGRNNVVEEKKRQAKFVVYYIITLGEKASFSLCSTHGDSELRRYHSVTKVAYLHWGKCTCMMGKRAKNFWRCIDRGVGVKEQVARSM
jgi:hypothetical protein